MLSYTIAKHAIKCANPHLSRKTSMNKNLAGGGAERPDISPQTSMGRETAGRCVNLTPKSPTTNIVPVAEVAQSVEHSTENAGVVSSILTLGTLDSSRSGVQPIGVLGVARTACGQP